MYDFFLSHTWRNDDQNRDTHRRVDQLRQALTDRGFIVWFDEENIKVGNIHTAMAAGIEHASVFVVCITRAYISKVHEGLSSLRNRDNCAHEWSCAVSRRKPMIGVVMESSMLGSSNWPYGPIPMHLASNLYVDASGDDWDRIAQKLISMYRSISPRTTVGIRPPPPPPHHKKLPPLPKPSVLDILEHQTPRSSYSLIGCNNAIRYLKRSIRL